MNNSAEMNKKIDARIRPLSESEISLICTVRKLNSSLEEFFDWVEKTDLPFKDRGFAHKKALEFYFSYKLLNPGPEDHYMDAAGGRSNYLQSVKRTSSCENLYLTDHIYRGCTKSPEGHYIVGGDITNINLPDMSLTKIACHHAFEHFHSDKDTGFILEISRLLKPGGVACIIPVFLTSEYFECCNTPSFHKSDKSAQLIIDLSASIPGSIDEGHFARFYSAEAFKRRVLEPASKNGLCAELISCTVEHKDVPDMDLNSGSKLNRPLRALLLQKLHE